VCQVVCKKLRSDVMAAIFMAPAFHLEHGD
jgi:hypothetical protein